MILDVQELPEGTERVTSSGVVKLEDGEACGMGDGVFIVFQETDGAVQTVVLTPGDLRAMLDPDEELALAA